jgi:molybdenum ABC transporter, periplasmic molybdate-binding protein
MHQAKAGILFAVVLGIAASMGGNGFAADKEKVSLTVAAAASLRYSFEDELIPLFQQKYPWIAVEGTYDSSGKLQSQIENGLDADVFMSAAMKQMNDLTEEEYIVPASIVQLLENKIVLIRNASGPVNIAGFADAANAGIIALGDPKSVPAGQYAEEAFTSLGIWDQVLAKASLGANVTEVLSWVAEGSADVGVVYATDAATNSKVAIIADAPEGGLKQKVIYPVGIATGSRHKEEAGLFVDFLKSEEGLAIFRKYGFTPNL